MIQLTGVGHPADTGITLMTGAFVIAFLVEDLISFKSSGSNVQVPLTATTTAHTNLRIWSLLCKWRQRQF